MKIFECSFQEFAVYVTKNNKKIICYGAGMLPLYIEPIMKQWNLLDLVSLFIDNNMVKQGKNLQYGSKKILIENLAYLKQLSPNDFVILITAEKYEELYFYMEKEINLKKWKVFAYPLLNISLFQKMYLDRIQKENNKKIPKIIHYTWFGKNEKNLLNQSCIDSWKKYCPDYKVIEWNESNYDVYKNRYIKQAYERKKWAYVSDYARLDILYENGGIYFDTDVELIKNIDELLTYDAFICFGEWPVPNSGAGIGCSKGNTIVKEMMSTRENISFVQENNDDDTFTNSNYEMKILQKHGFTMDFQYQSNENMTLLPTDIIAPVSRTGSNMFITNRTVGIHYCNNSWRKNCENNAIHSK
ncbi:MAG: glycosyltransferase [Lachnospiraceae bacterium]|nr:glycosyltransferase [Lachnospiraceae bacterium]